MDETNVRKAIAHSLSCWGVAKGLLQGKFREFAIDMALKKFNACRSFKFDKLTTIPEDRSEALRHVLAEDLKSIKHETMFLRISKTEDFFEPYYCTRKGSYLPKEIYAGYSAADLDPFNRFQFIEIDKSELIFRSWFNPSKSAEREGVLFEAALASHAVYSEACYSCMARKSLRWNGGFGGAWMDMVCINCKSTYEIKSKVNSEMVNQAKQKRFVYGGSFEYFYKYHNWIQRKKENGRAQEAEMYLVLIPRNKTHNRKTG